MGTPTNLEWVSSNETHSSRILCACIFCYKLTHHDHKNAKSATENFFTFLERLLGQQLIPNDMNNYNKTWACCSDCQYLTDLFCEVFHELKCVELKLKWRLWSVLNIMKCANRVPSRVKQMRKVIMGNDFTENINELRDTTYPRIIKEQHFIRIKDFRIGLIRKCGNYMENSYPRVLLERKLAGPEVVISTTQFPHADNDNKWSASDKISPTIHSNGLEMFLGWIMSVAAVVSLLPTSIADNDFATEVECNLENRNDTKMHAEIDSEMFVKTITNDAMESESVFIQMIQNAEKLESQPFEMDTVIFTNSEESKAHTNISTLRFKGDILNVLLYACKKCSKRFKHKISLRRHVISKHGVRKPTTKIFLCKFCKIPFLTYSKMLAHRLRLHKYKKELKIKLSLRRKSKPNKICKRKIYDGTKYKIQAVSESATMQIDKESVIRNLEKISAKTREYNLRERRLPVLMETEEDSDSHEDIFEPTNKSNSESEYSSSSFDDTSDDERTTAIIRQPKSEPSAIDTKPIVEYPSSEEGDPPEYFSCFLDGCRSRFFLKSSYLNHQKFHAPGEYQCKFCDTVEKNVVCLSVHENKVHSRRDKTHKKTNSALIYCPRCNFKTTTQRLWTYKVHFAVAHTQGYNKLEVKTELDKNEREIPCNFCKQKFSHKSWLQEHVKRRHSEASSDLLKASKYSVICPVNRCKKRFKTIEHLKSHQKLHAIFKCKFCKVSEDYAPNLAFHEAKVHAFRPENERKTLQESDPKRWNCSRCFENFQHKSEFVQHFLKKHLDISSMGHTCPICMAEFSTEKFYASHFKIFHKTDGLDPSEIHKCDKCSAYFIQRTQLHQHALSYHYNNKCPECCKTYSKPHVLYKHLREVHPKFPSLPSISFFCDIGTCKKSCSTKQGLRVHQKYCRESQQKEQDANFKCTKCEKVFAKRAQLYSHKQIRHTDLALICTECGKYFKTKVKLKIHMNYHKGPDAWKFQCSTCGRKFADNAKLRQHMRTHTKEKPYVCQYCGETYAHRHNWRNHVKAKHKEEYDKNDEFNEALRKISGAKMLSRKGSKKGDCLLAGKNQK